MSIDLCRAGCVDVDTIYGHRNGALRQEPYDRTLVSDALRRKLGVPAMRAQQKQVEALLGKRGKVAPTPDRIP